MKFRGIHPELTGIGRKQQFLEILFFGGRIIARRFTVQDHFITKGNI
jgi:hypothetical protein